MSFLIVWLIVFIIGGMVYMVVTPHSSEYERAHAKRDKWWQIK
jgi:hypothetical protein